MDTMLDATHYSFYIDEDDESIVINEEKLKASGLPFVRRYRTKSLSSSATTSSTLGEKRLSCSADGSLLSEDKSACALGLSTEECIVRFNALQLFDANNDKENKAPSEQTASCSSKECPLALSAENNSVDGSVERSLDGEILAQYLEPQGDLSLASQQILAQPSDRNACEVLAGGGNSAVVLSTPVAMSTPRHSRAARQSIAETGVDTMQQSPDSRSNSSNGEQKPVEFGSQFCNLEYLEMPRLIKEQLVSPCGEHTETAQPGHTGDDVPQPGNVSESWLCCSPVEIGANVVKYVPSEIPVCGASPVSLHSLLEERFQNVASATMPQHNCASVENLTPTKVYSAEHSGKTPTDPHKGEVCEQGCTASASTSSVTESNCLPVVHSGVEIACQTSFCISAAGAKSTACVTPARRLTIYKSPHRGAGSTPTKPFRRRQDSGVPGTVQGRSRTPSNIPVRGLCSATTPAKQRETVFKVPTPVAKKTPAKTPVKTPAKAEQHQSPRGSPWSSGNLVRSPWSVVSPVARYIHESPAPPLIHIVRARKSPSAKSLSAATSPAATSASSGSPKVCAAALPDKRYHSSNIGILHKAGLDSLVRPAKPIVIKHTIPSDAGDQSATEMEASVIQVIRH